MLVDGLLWFLAGVTLLPGALMALHELHHVLWDDKLQIDNAIAAGMLVTAGVWALTAI